MAKEIHKEREREREKEKEKMMLFLRVFDLEVGKTHMSPKKKKKKKDLFPLTRLQVWAK